MAKKATPHDGQLMLKLYDLRREAEMRKARNWFLVDFWPLNADDFVKVANAFPSQENSWLRQVGGYWDMASSLVLQGALLRRTFPAARLQRRNVLLLRQGAPVPQRDKAEDGRSRRVGQHREGSDRLEARVARDLPASLPMSRNAALHWLRGEEVDKLISTSQTIAVLCLLS